MCLGNISGDLSVNNMKKKKKKKKKDEMVVYDFSVDYKVLNILVVIWY